MSDPESPDPIPRPLKPILPPLTGASEQEPLRESAEPIFRPLRPILPPLMSREQKEKEAEDWREFREFQGLSKSRRYYKRLMLENLISFLEFGLLTTGALVVLYVFLFSTYQRKSILGTLLIVAVGYVLMRIIEGQLGRWAIRQSLYRPLDRLFGSNPTHDFLSEIRLLFSRPKPDHSINRYQLTNQAKRVTFKDIALPEQALYDLKRFVEFIREPQRYQKLGAYIERGVLLVGPSGIGKTLAGSALVGEANVPSFWLSEAPASLSELHDFLDCGPKNAPSILFIDNIDSIARSRSIWPDPQTQHLESMTTALVSFLDQTHNIGVFLFAATNRLDLIDEALIRPGRLRVIELSYPTLREVESILKIFTRKVPLGEDVDVSIIARRFLDVRPNCTGALIAEACNLAANRSAEKSAKLVNQESFLEALEQVCKGTTQRKHLNPKQ